VGVVVEGATLAGVSGVCVRWGVNLLIPRASPADYREVGGSIAFEDPHQLLSLRGAEVAYSQRSIVGYANFKQLAASCRDRSPETECGLTVSRWPVHYRDVRSRNMDGG
jgi:hypothetical protein